MDRTQVPGNFSGDVFEVLTEPFEHKGKTYVSYGTKDSTHPEVTQTNTFDRESYVRIHEPKFAVGDQVKLYDGPGRIIAVAGEPDKDGDFCYLVKEHGGYVDLVWENSISGKVSE